MLDRTDFASWQQRIRLYCRGKENGVNILKSIDEGPFQMGMFQEMLAEGNEGSLHLGLPKDIYSLINHFTDAKDIWDNVKMLLEGSELTKEDRESQLYDEFEHFHQNKGETIHNYYVRFAKLINDTRNIKMTMSKLQLNSKFVNNMLPEWGRFVTAVKLNKGLRDSNYDQLYAYLKQHETHANENKMMVDRIEDRVTMHGVQVQLVMGELRTELGMLIQENGVALDEEQLLFLAGGQDNAFDEDVDEPPVQDLALNVDNVFQADDCDAFDSDVNEAPTAQTMFMANLSSADPVYDEAGPSYDSDVISKYRNDSNMIPYDQYVKDNVVPVVQNNVSTIPNDAYMMIVNDMYEPNVQSVAKTTRNTVVNNSLTAELTTYKEQVELYERRARFELTERERKIDEQLRIVITDRNIKEENLKKELHSVKMQLTSTINHKKSMVEEVTSLKKNFKQKENKYLEEFLDMKALKEKVEDKLFKQDQYPNVLDTGKYAIDVEPYSPSQLEQLGKVLHSLSLGFIRESVDTLRENSGRRLKVRFGNDHFGAIMGYGDYVVGDSVISKVYCVEGLEHNLFFVDQFCDSDLEVTFRKHSCYVRDTDGVELLKARTMLIFSKAPMFLWAKVVATACYTQNHSVIHTRHDKTPYELVHNKKPDLTFFRVFGALCYPTNDSEDLGKLQPTANIGIFVGYAPSRKVPPPDSAMIIALKWIYKVKLDEYGDVLNKNKARTCSKKGILKEKSMSTNREGFVDPENPHHVIRLKNALYGLKIAPQGMKFDLHKSNPVDTPMVERTKLDEDLLGTLVDQTKYRSMIGSLMYLTASKPDLVFAVCMCARYQSRPTKKHLEAVKQVFREEHEEFAEFAGREEIGSTSGSAQFLGDNLVSWSSKKQTSTSISSTEAEYIVMSGCCAQILWMRSQLSDYGFACNHIPLYYDNESAISHLPATTFSSSRSKHIDFRIISSENKWKQDG
ncbi:retrovirus-related pol polyprotein from transposon TNT 1-94 [Tanacetum coccineum]